MKKAEEGDLNVQFKKKYNDEVGQLSSALESMAAKLRSVVTSILSGSESILSASMQMSTTATQMAQGVSEQASSTEEVSSSMEEISANVEQNKEHAQIAEGIATNGAGQIMLSNEAAQSNIDSMKEIAEKVSIITDIAFQTNILALNAAIEAARAGEQGRGFAVVAAEVRRLAERSKIAAGEIERISTNGVSKSIAAGDMLNAVIPNIQKTSRLVQEISAASLEQSSGANQINVALQQLNQVTQQNAAASEEMATSAEELSSQAEQLRDVVSYFQLGSGAQATERPSVPRAINREVEVKVVEKQKVKPEPEKTFSYAMDSNGNGMEKTLSNGNDGDYERF